MIHAFSLSHQRAEMEQLISSICLPILSYLILFYLICGSPSKCFQVICIFNSANFSSLWSKSFSSTWDNVLKNDMAKHQNNMKSHRNRFLTSSRYTYFQLCITDIRKWIKFTNDILNPNSKHWIRSLPVKKYYCAVC